MTSKLNNFTINSYLGYPNKLRYLIKKDLWGMNEYRFISIEDTEKIMDLMPFLKEEVLGGGFELLYNDEYILTLDETRYDIHSSLGDILTGLIGGFLQYKTSEVELPESGIVLRLEWVSNEEILFQKYSPRTFSKEWRFATKQFLEVLISHIEYVFKRIYELFGEASWGVEEAMRIKHIIYTVPMDSWWPLVVRGYIRDPFSNSTNQRLSIDCLSNGLYDIRYIDKDEWIGAVSVPTIQGFFYFESDGLAWFNRWESYPLASVGVALLEVIEKLMLGSCVSDAAVNDFDITMQLISPNSLRLSIKLFDDVVVKIVSMKLFLMTMLDVLHELFFRLDQLAVDIADKERYWNACKRASLCSEKVQNLVENGRFE